MAERRTEIRMMCAEMVEVRWKDRSGRAKSAMALLEDISESGACLQFESSIPVGSELKWESFQGCVRYCAYQEIGYFVGVEFNGSTKWSKKEFQPAHLLDPSRFS